LILPLPTNEISSHLRRFRSLFDRFRLPLRLRLVAVAVDRPKVVVIVRAAVGQGHDVVNLMRLADATELGAVITPTEVLISLQDSLTLAAPGSTTTA
jgi:hypothetical protein